MERMAEVIRYLNLYYWPQPDPPFPFDRFTLGEAKSLLAFFLLFLFMISKVLIRDLT